MAATTPVRGPACEGRNPLVVWAAATPWDGLRLSDQAMAAQLSRYADVLYVDPPISFLTRFSNPAAAAATGQRGITQVTDAVWRLAPRVPPLGHRRPWRQLALWSTRRAIAEAVRELGPRQVRALVVTSLSPLFGSAGEEVAVLYCKDDYAAGADLMGVQRSQGRLLRYTRDLPRRADVVVAVSPLIQASMRRHGREPLLIPNGVDADQFAHVPEPAPGAPPVVAFVGQLSRRVDVDLLVAVAKTGVRLRMVGPTQRTLPPEHFARLMTLGHRVEWTGRVRYDDLPGTLADVTTCLVPYADTPFNRSSFPLKILEYLAAGRRVVSTPLPAVGWLGSDLVTTAATPGPFARAVIASTAVPLEGDEVARRRAFARGHSWERRGELLAGALGLTAAAREAPAAVDRLT